MTGVKSKFGSLQLLSLLGPGKIFQQKSKSLSMMERKCLVVQVANGNKRHSSLETCHLVQS